jgi:cyclopropane fatty-acyl-phospholipid synthase-like methyltransferase
LNAGHFARRGATREETAYCLKLLLEKANRVLEIGSGWGGMAMCLAEAEEVEVTGVMLREEQLQAVA